MSTAGWQKGYAADCKSVYAGSSPTPALPFFCAMFLARRTRPGGETARRKGLKIPRSKGRAGWSPAPGTTKPRESHDEQEPRCCRSALRVRVSRSRKCADRGWRFRKRAHALHRQRRHRLCVRLELLRARRRCELLPDRRAERGTAFRIVDWRRSEDDEDHP